MAKKVAKKFGYKNPALTHVHVFFFFLFSSWEPGQWRSGKKLLLQQIWNTSLYPLNLEFFSRVFLFHDYRSFRDISATEMIQKMPCTLLNFIINLYYAYLTFSLIYFGFNEILWHNYPTLSVPGDLNMADNFRPIKWRVAQQVLPSHVFKK